MIKLGFSEVWTNKIMACISSVSYSFQLNGQRVGHMIPSRGLRQGDPLSPYLFLLCGEGLSSLLHHYEQSGDLQGLRCGLRGPTISHLFFSDDSLLFIEAKATACAVLKEVLNIYEAASGQAVNLSKSAVCFGPNLPEADAVNLTACLGVPRVRFHEKYLGLPCYSGKNKQGIFSSIKDRVWNKLCGWKIHTHPTSLAARVLQGLYFHKSTFLQVKVNSSSSFVWRSILWGRELYMQGLRCKIGSGWDTLIYHDGWLPRDGVFKTSSPQVLGKFDKVSSLITATGSRDSTLIRASFHKDEANTILSLPLPRRATPDSLIWHYHKSGCYTVRSGYWLALQHKSIPSSSTSSITYWWKKFWRLRIPSKIRIFLWKAFHNWIPSSVNLVKHGVPSQNRCLICNEANDTTLHALWGCNALDPLKVMIWFRRNKWIHEKVWLDDESCFSWARQHLADFVGVNCRKGDPLKKAAASTWQAPEIGVVKVNSDAAWCSKKKKFGL
ncbi:hypothetical protein UlMin_032364 [Ulmus minor]